MSLVSWHGVHLQLANTVILQEANWQIQPKARIALVGRNGAGKSTLLKLLQGDILPDRGQIQQQSGLRVAGLPQDVPDLTDALVFEIVVQGLGALGQVLLALRTHEAANAFDALAVCQQQLDDLQAWDSMPRVTTIASKLGLPLDARMGTLSGGMKRRVLLAKALVSAPDLLLLDEPTNHLDIPAMLWLESYLRTYTGTVVFVTHDRAFLSQVATSIVDLDRGHLHFYTCDYPTFLERREAWRLAEQQHHALLDKKLADEEAWLRTGVKARRTRNEGRVRALEAMRAAHQRRRSQQGHVTVAEAVVARAGSVVIEAQQLSYAPSAIPIIHDFSLVVQRGDKIGIIGPNGCGKTTLLRLLLGELKPDTGTVRLGTSLEIAYFDQLRQLLDPSKSIMANVADGADHVMIQGKAKHVASYLRDFLFLPEQYQQPVSSLSGGECNRLLLAKLLAKPANLLVMDEPTNDLDIETLELLENWLIDYPGTLLLISHDRAFINQVVTSVLVYEDDRRFHEYVGDYDSYLAHQAPLATARPAKPSVPPVSVRQLNYNEQRELAQLPAKIERLEQQIYSLQEGMLSATFYEQSLAQKAVIKRDLATQEAQLAALYLRWEDLEGR